MGFNSGFKGLRYHHFCVRICLNTFQQMKWFVWNFVRRPCHKETRNFRLSLLFSIIVCFWRDSPQWARASSFTRFLDHTPQTVGLLWTSDQLVAETYTSQHTTDIHASSGIRTHNLSRRAAADLRIRPRGHWDQLFYHYNHESKCWEPP